MPISKHDLVTEFGVLMDAGNAALFLGAGMSAGSGLPGWAAVAKELRTGATIPDSVQDGALVAEYYAMRRGGHAALDAELLRILGHAPGTSRALQRLCEIDVPEFWTTNYDTLIEGHLPTRGTVVISGDADYTSKRTLPAKRRVIKIHGNLAQPTRSGSRRWTTPPIMTRSDFERYPVEHPVLWSVLRAAYLSRSMLFLGISFDDPNLHVLLALARSLPADKGSPNHYAVMRVPTDPDERDLWQFRRDDLEDSGVEICEITDFSELDGICGDLALRNRPPNLFVSGTTGSDDLPGSPGHLDPDPTVTEAALQLGSRLARLSPDFGLQSLAGPSAIAVAEGMRSVLALEEYDPRRIVFHYRRRGDAPPPRLPSRNGTAIYWGDEVEDVRSRVFRSCRALALLGAAGNRSMREVVEAREMGLPVIPLAFTGSAAAELWSTASPSTLLGFTSHRVEAYWSRLMVPGAVGVDAAAELIRLAMFLGQMPDLG